MAKHHLHLNRIFFVLFCLSLIAVVSKANLVGYWSPDVMVVDRAEVIAIGHLQENSIQYIPHPNTPWENEWLINDARTSRPNETNFVPYPLSGEYHATLLVSEVIKGQCTSNNIPIILHFGLRPNIGGYEINDYLNKNSRSGNTNYPLNSVRIVERPGDVIGFGDEIGAEDASKDYIWFLRRGHGNWGETLDTTNNLGVMHFPDLQPLNLEEYFKLYLKPHPESELRKYALDHPELDIAARIQSQVVYFSYTNRELKWSFSNPTNPPAVNFSGKLPESGQSSSKHP